MFLVQTEHSRNLQKTAGNMHVPGMAAAAANRKQNTNINSNFYIQFWILDAVLEYALCYAGLEYYYTLLLLRVYSENSIFL